MALNLAHKSTLAGLNSGCTTDARQMRLDAIHLSDEFSSLFPVNPVVLAQIVESIKKHGFDYSQPLHVWKERNCTMPSVSLQSASAVRVSLVRRNSNGFESRS